jgi:copper chaperone
MAGKIKKSTYVVGGLKGDHSRDRIKYTISSLAGIDDVEVDLNTKQVTVEYDSSIIASGYIQETLQTLGFSIQG